MREIQLNTSPAGVFGWKTLLSILVAVLGVAQTKTIRLMGKEASATIENVDLQDFKVLSFRGEGSVDLSFSPRPTSRSEPKALLSRTVYIYESRWLVLPQERHSYDLHLKCQEGSECKLSVDVLENESEKLITPSATENHLTFDFSARANLDFSFLVSLKGLFKSPDFTGSKKPKLRFESFAQQTGIGSSDGFFSKDSHFSMVIFKKDQNKPISKPSTELGMNLFATLEPKDADYEWSDNAVYKVVLKANSVSMAVFSVNLIPDVQVFDLSKSQKTYSEVRVVSDQVYAGSVNKYEIILPKFTSIQFDLTPVEGNPDIFINPDDNNGWDVSTYKYKSEKDLRESIMITQTELHKLGKKASDRLFVVVNSKVESTYTLNFELWPENYSGSTTRGLRPNTFYSGTVLDKQVINFVLDFDVVIPETMSAFISLKARAGNPDLYIKDCEDQTACEFTLDEIERLVKQEKERAKSNTAAKDDGMYFRYSDNLQDSDDLYFEMNMVPYGAAHYTEKTGSKLPTFNNKLKTSKLNRICVAILGHTNSLSKLSEYTLIAKSRGGHSVLAEYKSEFIYLGPSDQKYFVFSPLHLPTEVVGIIAKFDIAHGDASVYFSANNKFPTAESHDQMLEVDNDQSVLESRTLYMNISRSKLASQVYFGVSAKKQTLVNLLITYWISEQKSGESIRLIPGVPIYGQVVHVDRYTVKLFKGKADAKKADAFIKITSDSTFLMTCAAQQKDPKVFVKKDDCITTSLDELLPIPFNTVDSEQSDWVIFVEVAGVNPSESYSVSEVKQVSYKIELLTSRSIAPLGGDGTVTEGIISDKEGVIHYHEFWLEDKNKHIWVHVQSPTGTHLLATASMNKSEIYRLASIGSVGPGWGLMDYTNNEQTFVFKADDIRPYCELPVSDNTLPPGRLLQDAQEGPTTLKIIRPSKICKIYIKIAPGYLGSDTTVLNPKPYRVLFARDTDTIRLQRGKRYSLPTPLNAPLKIVSEAKSFQTGISVSVKSYSTNLASVLSVLLAEKSSGKKQFESTKILSTTKFSQFLVLPGESFKDAPSNLDNLEALAVLTLEKNGKSTNSFEQVPSDPTAPVHPYSSLSVMFDSEINILELSTPVHGIAQQGRFLSDRRFVCLLHTEGEFQRRGDFGAAHRQKHRRRHICAARHHSPDDQRLLPQVY